MSELWTFAGLGFRHITDPGGLDHVLFLLVLAAVYRVREWRVALWVVTAFTVGHSLTLALAALHVVAFPIALIEFLIPVTIVATALENLLMRDRSVAWLRRRSLLAGAFGLIHGAGFANYLDSLALEHPLVPLLGFNLGIEAGQILVLVAAVTAMTGVDWGLERILRSSPGLSPLRLRTTAVSVVVGAVATQWAIARAGF